MPKPYQCPHAKRANLGLVKFMMCDAQMDYTKCSYKTAEECVTAMCHYAYYCQVTSRWEVDSNAKHKCTILSMDGGTGNG